MGDEAPHQRIFRDTGGLARGQPDDKEQPVQLSRTVAVSSALDAEVPAARIRGPVSEARPPPEIGAGDRLLSQHRKIGSRGGLNRVARALDGRTPPYRAVR